MSEWIEHDGKSMPVDGRTRVFVRLRCGEDDEITHPENPIEASFWNGDGDESEESNWVWFHEYPEWFHIIEYKIVS